MNHQQKIELFRIGKFLLAVLIVTALTTHIYESDSTETWLLDYIISNKTAARVTGFLLLLYAFQLCLGANNCVARITGNPFTFLKMHKKNW
jgi:hypothetical protein